MANPHRGEVDVGTDGHCKMFRLTINAACALEARTGHTLKTVLEGVDQLSILKIREVVWALLQPYHAAEFTTMDAVGAWMDDVGLASVTLGIARVLELNAPEEGGAAADPPMTPAAGTGDGSSLRVAV
jgi:hypothetical protein